MSEALPPRDPDASITIEASYEWTEEQWSQMNACLLRRRLVDWRRQLKVLLSYASYAVSWFLLLVFVMVPAGSIAAWAWIIVGFAAPFVVVALARRRVTRARRRFPTLRSYRQRIDITLDERGVAFRSPDVEHRWSWPAISHAASAEHGLFLHDGAVYRWLPFDALRRGTPQEARDFVRRQVKAFVLW